MTDPTQTEAERVLAADLIALRQANPPDAAFAAELEDRLRAVIAARYASGPTVFSSNGRITTRARQSRRRIALLAASLALVILLFLTVPALRTFAQNIIRQIGGILITDAPSPGEERVKEWQQVESTPALFRYAQNSEQTDTLPSIFQPKSGAQISAAVGFTVYEANEIEGCPPFELNSYDVATRADSTFLILHYTWYGNQVHLVETRADDPALAPIWNRHPALPPGEAVTVRGEPGLWFSDFTLDDPEFQAQVDEFNAMWGGLVKSIKLLAWREGDRAFVIQSPSFSLGLMQAMADSLAPVSESRQFSATWPNMTDAELTEQAGFAPYAPVGLPDHYYRLWRYVASLDGADVIVSHYRYIPPGWFAEVLFHSDQLLLWQIASNDSYTIGLGDAPLEDVTVNGQPGVWIAQWANGAWLYAPALEQTIGQTWDYQRANVLIWETGGYTFILHNAGAMHFVDPDRLYEQLPPRLSQDTMLRIAESVAPLSDVNP